VSPHHQQSNEPVPGKQKPGRIATRLICCSAVPNCRPSTQTRLSAFASRARHDGEGLRRLQEQRRPYGRVVPPEKFGVGEGLAGTGQKSVHTKMLMKHFLCVGCIEKRIGRRLTRADFDMRSNHNKPDDPRRQFPMSRRLRSRLKE
jgi:hypothetical protein